ncbi:AsmA-like C-terminal domain-containing protein [Desulfosarcina ovata]|uniref:YhdP central domain-containing protein n=1 Tax=Desulfosarcina ovata subsp. ovata TaxID=2752305 RepID=A0A5K8AKZ5_9BACT|nr:AsmA-like C-terminal domain-containing protein [Desulfosarcina ovata]BBO93278.1 hypothetical protein DSCOOX_64580 [Desulfosarcina ovata subsp. ovata]
MRRTRKLFMISLGCAVISMFLLLSAVLVTRLLSNREMVKTFLVTKTAQATGGQLDYARLELSLLPIPHLEAHALHLFQPQTFDLKARKLSLYPALRPALSGRFSVSRLTLDRPDVCILQEPGGPQAKADEADGKGQDLPAKRIDTLLKHAFGMLASIDPGTELEIGDGRIRFTPGGLTEIRASGIDATFENQDGQLSLGIHGRSTLTGVFDLSAHADVHAARAAGTIAMTGLDVEPVLAFAALPGGIGAKASQAAINMNFRMDSFDSAEIQFRIKAPKLTVTRNDRSLALNTADSTGTLSYDHGDLSLVIDRLATQHPKLNLSAAASLGKAGGTGNPTLTLRAAARQLDVAVAGNVARTIAGDQRAIRTAFNVARTGQLTGATYYAGFENENHGWQLKKMVATGHLSQGRITIPKIDTDLEQMDGDVVYIDKRVDFKNVSGHFQGIDFKQLKSRIDWEKRATLSIDTSSAQVDAAVLFPWLTHFKGLEAARNYISAVTGSAQLSRLKIDGPLGHPEKWQLEITGTPEAVRLTSPHTPFPITLSGGTITYVPGAERSSGVSVHFLDTTLQAAHQSSGILHPESLSCEVDGSMGPAAIDWLSTLLPIPAYLQIKPPVALSGVKIQWNGKDAMAVAVAGRLKTAGGVDLCADMYRTADTWGISDLRFADGHSTATLSASRQGDVVNLTFSGNVEKKTVDQLLRHNQTLSGRVQGNFSACIDMAQPIGSAFTGNVSGDGLHLKWLTPIPVTLDRFSIAGVGDRATFTATQIAVDKSLLVVNGSVANTDGAPTFELTVDADQLDDALLQKLFSEKTHTNSDQETAAPAGGIPHGTVHLRTERFSADAFTWSPLSATVTVAGQSIHVQLEKALLCGIATPGELDFSPRGIRLDIFPKASGTSLQESANCLLPNPVTADARYDLSGEIHMPATQKDFSGALTGSLTVSSKNGRIEYSSVLMKIFSALNITELLTGKESDLNKKGYGYSSARIEATIDGGRIHLTEVLLDGNSLKITGEGQIQIGEKTADIYLLAAPLKTIDRIVGKVPIIGYLTGGSLISIPLRVHGPLDDLSVVPMSPSAVGKGLLNLMERTLKAPFKLVESAASLASDASSEEKKADGAPQTAPQP